MDLALINLLYAIGLLFGALLFLGAGRRIGLRRIAKDPEGERNL
jgi:hypothetical protein